MNKLKELHTKWVGYLFVLRMQRLKRKANKFTAKTNIQCFIVLLKGKVTLISKPTFTKMRQKGLFPKSFTADRLKQIAFYYTTPKAVMDKR